MMRPPLLSFAFLLAMLCNPAAQAKPKPKPAVKVPPTPAQWGAISPYYLKEAVAARGTAANKGWDEAPFCWHWDDDGSVKPHAQCRDYLKESPKHQSCGVQNIANGKWNPDIVGKDPSLL